MDTDKAISLSGVVKEYPGMRALDGVSFEVERGRIHGFLGPNGAGKSTSMRIITGLISANSGSVIVSGIDVNKQRREVRGKVGFLPEQPPLYLGMRVRDYLKLVLDLHSLKKNIPTSRVGEVMEECGLSDVSHRLVGNLSKGYRQRVGIAQALVSNPEIIILDEPTVGLDPVAIAEIRALIQSLAPARTVLLSTHLLHEAALICSHATIINKGRVLSSGLLSDIEKRFQMTNTVVAKVMRWNEGLQSQVQSQLGLSVEKIDGIEGEMTVRLSGASGDMREQISKLLVDHGAGLMGLAQEKADLEMIFKSLTGGRQG